MKTIIEMAREAGFDAVSAQGTVEDLLALILAEGPKAALAHIRGKEARGDLGPRLRANGINCVDVVAYGHSNVLSAMLFLSDCLWVTWLYRPVACKPIAILGSGWLLQKVI